MASESITFDFISRGASTLAGDFKKTGDNAAAAARGAKVLQDTIKTLGDKENRTAAESANLARALKLTGDAEDRAAAKALAAEIAISRLDESMKNAGKNAGGGGFASLAGEITGFGAAAGVADSKSSLFSKALAGINLATGVLEPALAGVVVAVGGLAAGFASAGAALGAFGLVAGANLSAAGTAAGKASTAQTAYAAAVAAANAKYKEQIGTATTAAQRQAAATARQNALQSAQAAQVRATTAAYAGLTPAQVALSKSIGVMQDRWHKFTASFAPQVSSIVGVVQPLFGTVLKYVGQLATAGGTALQALLPSLGVALNSKGFKDFITTLASNAGPAIVKLGVAIGHIATGFGGILKAFLPFSQGLLTGLDKITAKFATWGQTLSSHSGFQSLIATFKTETPLAIQLLQNLGVVLVNVGKAVTGLSGVGNSKALLQALLPLSGVLASLSKNTDLDRIVLYLIAARSAAVKLGPAFLGIKAAVSFFPSAWQAIVKFSGAVEGAAAKEVIAGAAAKVWAGAQAVLNAVMDANPIVLVAAAAAALAAGFYIAWQKSSLFRDVIKDIGTALLTAGIVVVKANKVIVDSFLSMVGTVLHGAADAFGWIPGLGSKLRGASKAFDDFKAGTDNVFNGVIKTMQGWQNELGAAKRTSDTTTAAIVANFRGQGKAATQGRQDVTDYTQAVQANGSKSDAARSARQRLITDLEKSGVSASGAERLVNNLQASISRLKGKTVTVGANATASGAISIVGSGWAAGSGNIRFHAARGAYVSTGASATADDNLARVSKGELIVPAHMVQAGAVNHLRGRIPGFASGGFTGVESSLAGITPAASSFTGGDAKKAVTAGVAEAMAKAKAAAAAKELALIRSVSSATGALGGPTSASAAQAQAYARSRLAAYGWGAVQMTPLISLWNQESGWNRLARNPSSGAYGIPQALPASKMGAAANPPASSAAAQINWGLSYIKGRYGSPAGAWGHEVGFNWYDKGGWLKPGVTLAVNNTGRPEQVIPPGGTAAGGVHLHLTVNAPIGSQQQLEDWFVRVANKTAQHGRLTQAVKTANR